jgi:hypothetical protein
LVVIRISKNPLLPNPVLSAESTDRPANAGNQRQDGKSCAQAAVGQPQREQEPDNRRYRRIFVFN